MPESQQNGSICFEHKVNNKNQVIAFIEIKRQYIKKTNYRELKNTIKKIIFTEFQCNFFDIIFIKPLHGPKTSSGKKQRSKAKLLFSNKTISCLSTIYKNKNNTKTKKPLSETESILLSIINGTISSNIVESTHITEIGLNSLNLVSMLSKVNDTFEVNINITDIFDIKTTSDIANLIETEQTKVFESLVT